MELRHLEYFVAVAEELHFGRAAERLQMTQPPLSQQILQLEGELGVTLFRRNKRHVELTAAGEVFLHEVRKVFSQLEKAVERTQRSARGQAGQLVVGFVGSATYDVLPPIVREYRAKFPGVDLVLKELGTPAQMRALHDKEIDVGFLRPPIESAALSVEVIQQANCVVALPKLHPLAGAAAVSLRDLRGESFVVITRSIWPGFYDEIIRLCRQMGFSPNIVQEATEFQTLIGLIAAGIGVSIVPASARNFHAKDVVYVDMDGAAPAVEMGVAWRKGDETATVQAFLEVVRQVVQSQ